MVVAIVLATVGLGYFASRIQVDTEILRLLPQDSKTNRLIQKYGEGTKNVEYLFLVVTGKDIFSLDKLEALGKVIGQIESIGGVQGSVTPFNVPIFRRNGVHIGIQPLSDNGKPPTDTSQLKTFRNRLLNYPPAKDLVVSEDGTALCAIFQVGVVQNFGPLLGQVHKIVSGLNGIYSTHIAGWIPFDNATKRALLEDPPRLIAVAICVILLVFFLSFGSLPALFLPLLSITVGMVWTTGIMSLLGMPFSVASIMTPVLIMAVGSSYSIHTLNQYYYDAAEDSSSRDWMIPGLCHITRTIVSASLTTAIGFASLLAAEVLRIRQFGLSTGIGVLVSALLTLFLYPAVLVHLGRPKGSTARRARAGMLARGMHRIGLRMDRFRYVALLLFLGIIAAFVLSLFHVSYQTDYTAYFRNKIPALTANRVLMQKFGGFMYLNLTLTAPNDKSGYFLNRGVLNRISRFEDTLLQDPDITYVSSLPEYIKAINYSLTGKYVFPHNDALIQLLSRYFAANGGVPKQYRDLLLVNKDFSRLTLQIRMYNSDTKWFLFEHRFARVVDHIRTKAAQMLPKETNPQLWGWNLVALELARLLVHDQVASILVALVLVFLVASATLRSFVFGLYCLIPLAMGIMLNFVMMWLFHIPFDVLTSMFSSVAIGVGIDDAIHLLLQYRHFSRLFPDDRRKAISHAVAMAGRPIVLTSASVVAGLFALSFSSFMPVIYFGVLVSLAMFSTTVGALVFLPAFLSFGGGMKTRRRDVLKSTRREV